MNTFANGDLVKCVSPDYRNILTICETYVVESVIEVYAQEDYLILNGLPSLPWCSSRFELVTKAP